MRIAFVLDPLESLKVGKDSSIAMMRAAQAAGHAVWAIQQSAIHYSSLHGVCAEALHLQMQEEDTEWYQEILCHTVPLRDFAAVIMRKDPPFDFEYLATSWLLERAEAGGWQIVWSDEPPVKPGQRVSKKRVPAPLQALGFSLDEIKDARLAPIVDFKGRAGKAGAAPAA